MLKDTAETRKQHFAENWLAWSALHHFLPVPMFRELASIIVDKLSNGTLSLEHLFDETITDGPSCLDSWLLCPIEQSSPLANYLQRRIRGFAWQNDPGAFSTEEDTALPGTISPSFLEKAIELGAADFMLSDWSLNNLPVAVQPSFDKFLEAFKIARESISLPELNDFTNAILPSVATIDPPLATVVIKHLGDLCADADEWDKAYALYEEAEARLEKIHAWGALTSLLRAIITQSKASAIMTISGASEASSLFNNVLNEGTAKDNPLLLGNGSFDAFVAESEANFSSIAADRRTVLMFPPLLHKTHNVTSALRGWLSGDYNDASRLFWAVLRRQIALGSASEARQTRALYARNIFAQITQNFRQSNPKSFHMALRLLIESGDHKTVKKIAWEERVIDTYVDLECIRRVIAHAHAHKGCQITRQLVTIEIFREWSEKINLDRTDVAMMMLKHLAMLAIESTSTIYEGRDIGGKSLEALKSLAQKRPELRRCIVTEVATLVSKKISTPAFWRDHELAIETTIAFLDVFPTDSLLLVINSTLSLLDNIKPETGMWMIVRPALNLLSSRVVKRFVRGKRPDIEQRIISNILRFGLEQESEHANVLFYLHNFDQELLQDRLVQETLQDAVKHVRHSATRTNTSNVVENIQALLLASGVAGRSGVEDALQGLTLILRSVGERRPSIGLPSAYDPLLLLADRQNRIARDISVSAEEFRAWLVPLVALIVDVWTIAKDQPVLFAPFSFPPASQPDSVIVHNWAFASICFAESVEEYDRVLEALTAAEEQPALRDAIALAKATWSATDDDRSIVPESVRSDSRDAFYSTLGRRLAVLQKLDDEQGRELCKALLDQCMRFGPRCLDAAVFISANRLDLSKYVDAASFSEYMKRMEGDRDLRLALIHILNLIKPKSEDNVENDDEEI